MRSLTDYSQLRRSPFHLIQKVHINFVVEQQKRLSDYQKQQLQAALTGHEVLMHLLLLGSLFHYSVDRVFLTSVKMANESPVPIIVLAAEGTSPLYRT